MRPSPDPGIEAEPGDAPDLGLLRFLDDTGRLLAAAPEIAPERLLLVYRTMLRLRALDERMLILQRQGRVGFYAACTGQEAAVLASSAALEPDDWIFPAFREGGAMLLRGFDLFTYLCQVYGNAADALVGRQMPSHMASRRVNQVSGSTCVGSQFPQAVGAGYAMRLEGGRKVAMGFIGDGGTASADFHVAMNMAGVFQPQVVLVCQNNQWSISTPTERESASQTIAVKARAYGLPGVRVDGNDALAVYAACRAAVDRARGGGGPTFLELVTYRIGAHSLSDDPRIYRDEREVEAWKRRDPIARLRAYLVAEARLGEVEDARLRADAEAEVAAAVEKAEAAPAPPIETLFEDVYAEVPASLAEQRDALLGERS